MTSFVRSVPFVPRMCPENPGTLAGAQWGHNGALEAMGQPAGRNRNAKPQKHLRPTEAGRSEVEARGFEPRSEPGSYPASTCVGCA